MTYSILQHMEAAIIIVCIALVLGFMAILVCCCIGNDRSRAAAVYHITAADGKTYTGDHVEVWDGRVRFQVNGRQMVICGNYTMEMVPQVEK